MSTSLKRACIELEENRYDADREGFAGKIFGTPVFVSIPREAAKALRDSGAPLLIRGELRYHGGKSAEVLKAMLAGTDGTYPVTAECIFKMLAGLSA